MRKPYIKHCRHCKTQKEPLYKSTRNLEKGYQYWVCKKCNLESKTKWYNKNRKKAGIIVMMSNMRSYAKRFGYRLIKKIK